MEPVREKRISGDAAICFSVGCLSGKNGLPFGAISFCPDSKRSWHTMVFGAASGKTNAEIRLARFDLLIDVQKAPLDVETDAGVRLRKTGDVGGEKIMDDGVESRR